MIPAVSSNLRKKLEIKKQPSLNFKMHLRENTIYSEADKKEAMEQVIYKIINTNRYDFLIYSRNYGIELKDLFGMPVNYVCPELESRIREALVQDDRVASVEDFEFDLSQRHRVTAVFTVRTDFGDVKAVKEVEY